MAKRTIYANRIIEAIRSGMGDVPIMEKYQISPGEFMEILRKLKRGDPTDSEKIEARLIELEKNLNPSEMRSMPRNYMVFQVTVEDTDDASVFGTVNDITESGFQVEGIQSNVDDAGRFVIRSEILAEDTEIVFEAVCRWTKPGAITENDVAGFEITSISESSLGELRKLIRYLSLGERP